MHGNLNRLDLFRWGGCAALCFAMAGLCAVPAAADRNDKKTIVTFNAPVEIPGKVLPAGTYVFQVVDSGYDRDVVEIRDRDHNKLEDTFMAIPDYRAVRPGKTIITFEERASNNPEALKSWFYPGDNYGVQFIYPYHQALEIAKRTNQNVLATRDESGKDLKHGTIVGVNPAGQDVHTDTVVEPSPHH